MADIRLFDICFCQEVQVETDPMPDKSMEEAQNDVVVLQDCEQESDVPQQTDVICDENFNGCATTSSDLLVLQNASPINVIPSPTDDGRTTMKSTQTSLALLGSQAYATTTPDRRTVTSPMPLNKPVTYGMGTRQMPLQVKRDPVVKRPRGRPRKKKPTVSTKAAVAPTVQVPLQYRPSPASSNTSLPGTMQNMCNDGRQLPRAFTNDGQGVQWLVPFPQYQYEDCQTRQAPPYQVQGRPYAGINYNHDMYRMNQPYRDDMGEVHNFK